jgi:Domain of unknown function (DUF4333)
MTHTLDRRPIRAMQFAVMALIAGFALTACGSSVDVPGLEKNIKSSLQGVVKKNTIDSDLAVSSVSCPKNPSTSGGSKFDCDFTLEDDSKGVATATVSDNGDISYTVSRYAAGQISQDIGHFFAKDQDIDVNATCANPVKDGMVCDFKDGDGATGKITVTISDKKREYSPKYDCRPGRGRPAGRAWTTSDRLAPSGRDPSDLDVQSGSLGSS